MHRERRKNKNNCRYESKTRKWPLQDLIVPRSVVTNLVISRKCHDILVLYILVLITSMEEKQILKMKLIPYRKYQKFERGNWLKNCGWPEHFWEYIPSSTDWAYIYFYMVSGFNVLQTTVKRLEGKGKDLLFCFTQYTSKWGIKKINDLKGTCFTTFKLKNYRK